MKQPQIKIPKVNEKEIFSAPSGLLGGINKKFEEIYQVISGINLVVVLSLVAIIISVIGIFLDQMRFNSTLYKEYSDKTQSLDLIQKSNKFLLEQSIQNQQIIIDLQKQLQDKLK
jgi:hypothetical protein